jgi:hypothetical protein
VQGRRTKIQTAMSYQRGKPIVHNAELRLPRFDNSHMPSDLAYVIMLMPSPAWSTR